MLQIKVKSPANPMVYWTHERPWVLLLIIPTETLKNTRVQEEREKKPISTPPHPDPGRGWVVIISQEKNIWKWRWAFVILPGFLSTASFVSSPLPSFCSNRGRPSKRTLPLKESHAPNKWLLFPLHQNLHFVRDSHVEGKLIWLIHTNIEKSSICQKVFALPDVHN